MARVDMDLQNDKTQNDFSPVPPGEYDVRIVDSAVAESKSGKYLFVKLDLDVVSPPEFKGRKIWDQLNVKGIAHDANEDAVRIGREKLKTIATIGGHKNPNFIRDTEELHGMVLGVRVEVDGEYNRVKGYKKPVYIGNQSHQPAAAIPPEVAAQAIQQQAAQQAQFPWQKR